MCTAITYKTKSHYFGRNLDLEYSYDESVTIVPRNYRFEFRKAGILENHYAMIGMAYVVDEYPLFYDATNEKGLSMAGLNFPGNAYYGEALNEKEACDVQRGKANGYGTNNVAPMVNNISYKISPFELIPWFLAKCADVAEARRLLQQTKLVAINYSEKLPLTPLHWIVADKRESIVVEPLKEGLKIYDNPVGVLANNPTFDYHMMNLNNYMNLTADEASFRELVQDVRVKEYVDDEPDSDRPWENMKFHRYSRGMGAMGVPGDWSSPSRFVRATFVKMNSVSGDSEQESVSQFMHILGSVAMPRGCVHMGEGKHEITVYSSCCNTDEGIYYYWTYDDTELHSVNMNKENLDGTRLLVHPVNMDVAK